MTHAHAPTSGADQAILVVGGGMSGMSAALATARAGQRTVIVEKSAVLGGAMARMRGCTPRRPPYTDVEDTGVAELISDIEAHELVTVYRNSSVSELTAPTGDAVTPGGFVAKITAGGGDDVVDRFGAVILATGWRPYDAHRLGYLGYNDHADVVTQMELEELAKAADFGPIKRPSDGRAVRSVLFLQCAGQRSLVEGELSGCANHCCMTAIKQAMYFKDSDPDIETTLLYSDLRTPGARGEQFLRAGLRKAVTFVRGRFDSVVSGPAGLIAGFTDEILDAPHRQTYDLVVLATGMHPNGIPVDTRNNDKDTDPEDISETVLDAVVGDATRQPPLADAYTAAALPGLPYATAHPGIFLAGASKQPMDLHRAMEDGIGAALKALQSLSRVAHGEGSERMDNKPS